MVEGMGGNPGDILHPKSEAMEEYKGFIRDPASHPNYLKGEKASSGWKWRGRQKLI